LARGRDVSEAKEKANRIRDQIKLK
jgi:hypothetical protein